MSDVITSRQLMLLQLVARHPDVARDHMVKAGAAEADIVYLVRHDLIRERGVGQFRISHMGQQVLKRGL